MNYLRTCGNGILKINQLIIYFTNMCQSGQGTFSEHLGLLIGLSWLKDMGWLLLVYKTHKIETWLAVEGKGLNDPTTTNGCQKPSTGTLLNL
jgi:hypothetical protein